MLTNRLGPAHALVLGMVLCQSTQPGTAAGEDMVVVKEMTRIAQTAVALEHPTVIITQLHGQASPVPVAVTRSRCRASVRTTIDGVVKDWSGELSLFTISSTDRAAPFTWVLCTSWPMDRVGLVTDEKAGKPYFFVTIWSRTFLIEIAGPRDKAEAIADFFLVRDWNDGLHVPIGDVIEAMRPLAVIKDALHGPDITVTSIANGQEGWRLGVHDLRSDTVFALVSSDGEHWRLGQ